MIFGELVSCCCVIAEDSSGKKPNVKFENRVDEKGQINIGVWVMTEPIKKGSELLVSYGKGFWNARKEQKEEEEEEEETEVQEPPAQIPG